MSKPILDYQNLYSWCLPSIKKEVNPMDGFEYLDELSAIAKTDTEELVRKEQTYQGSWKKRGGAGAFMMLARKWDRLETISKNDTYDLFRIIEKEGLVGEDGTLIAEIRDLRRYLMLVEAYMTRDMKP